MSLNSLSSSVNGTHSSPINVSRSCARHRRRRQTSNAKGRPLAVLHPLRSRPGRGMRGAPEALRRKNACPRCLRGRLRRNPRRGTNTESSKDKRRNGVVRMQTRRSMMATEH
eukprot:6173284-Pleurochrysis_carterae.AAC.2